MQRVFKIYFDIQFYKGEAMENFRILENMAKFEPSDLDEIMVSIGCQKPENVDTRTAWAHYNIFRYVDYFVIAKVGDKTVGLLEAFTDRDNAHTSYLYSVIVHKDYQRRGIGRALMEAFNKKFEHTTTWAITPVTADKGAVKFLEKFGFKDNSANFTVCSRFRKEAGD